MATKEQVSRGESFEVTVLDRAFTGKEFSAFRISGGVLANPVTGVPAEQPGDIISKGVTLGTLAGSNNMFFTAASGVASPGPVTLTGAKVGDKVVGVIDITTAASPASSAANFETTISVKDSIAQTGSSLNGHGLLFIIVHAS